MREQLVDRVPFAKILIALAIAFLLSLGLCGLSGVFALGGSAAHVRVGSLVGPAAGFGLLGMTLSAAALILTCMVWVVLKAVGSFSKKVSQPQTSVDEEDDTNLDERD
jgi:membrane protein implicated in regulation of membrane protease activity